MKFLFISTILGPVGGLEVQIARMSKWLLDRGHNVTLLTNSIAESGGLYPEKIKILELGDQLSELSLWHKGRRTFYVYQIETPDVIKAFDLAASWIASILCAAISPRPKIIFGNYFPYVIPHSRNLFTYAFFRLYLYNLNRTCSDNSLLFMSAEHINEFRRYYGFHKNPIFWPIPVGDPSISGPERTPRWGHIVSVGRLAKMKEYNLYMIDLVARLRQKGLPVTWTVYGEGELASEMRARIEFLGLSDAIEMRGRLENSQFAAAIRDAYLYVGMGTSMIEAALCRVPGVVALAHDTSGVTYGPLHLFRFGNVGELMDTPPRKTVEEEIERLLNLQPHEYAVEAERCREYAKEYEVTRSMERFMRIVANSSASKPSYFLFYSYYLYSFFNWFRQKIRLYFHPSYS